MRIQVVSVVVGMALIGAAVALSAHHAFSAEFSVDKPVTLQGVVTKIEWVNPHTWMYIDVKNPDGTVVNWAIEGGAPNTLIRRGVRKNSLPPGVEVTVEGYQAKNGANVANGRNITWPSGLTLSLASPGTGAPEK
jgi:hypothetical protein